MKIVRPGPRTIEFSPETSQHLRTILASKTYATIEQAVEAGLRVISTKIPKAKRVGFWPCDDPDPSDIDGEEWKPIKGFPNYRVSNLGRVWSYIRRKMMTRTPNPKGYRRVILTPAKGKKAKHIQVSLLVAFTFIGPPNGGETEVDHKNRNKADDRLENLEWLSHLKNVERAIVTGEDHHRSKITSQEKRDILDLHRRGFSSKNIARHFPITPTRINQIVREAKRAAGW